MATPKNKSYFREIGIIGFSGGLFLFAGPACVTAFAAQGAAVAATQDAAIDAALMPTPEEDRRNTMACRFFHRRPLPRPGLGFNRAPRVVIRPTCTPEDEAAVQIEITALRNALLDKDAPSAGRLLSSEHLRVRAAAVRALGLLGGEDATQALINSLNDDNTSSDALLMILVSDALIKIAPVERLGSALNSPSWRQQRGVSAVLGRIGLAADAAAPALGKLCLTPGGNAWQESYNALRAIGGPKADEARGRCIESYAHSIEPKPDLYSGGCGALAPKLGEWLRTDKLPPMRSGSYEESLFDDGFTTSYLISAATPPISALPPRQANLDAWFDALTAYQKSLPPASDIAAAAAEAKCEYAPRSAWDGDPKTAWVAGGGRDGIGEVLIAPKTADRLEIWAGYGKSGALFKANNRPKEVRIYLIAGTAKQTDEEMESEATTYSDLRVLGARTATLDDLNGYQPLPLPNASKAAGTQFVAVEILSVYRGTKYHDTAISEIRPVK